MSQRLRTRSPGRRYTPSWNAESEGIFPGKEGRLRACSWRGDFSCLSGLAISLRGRQASEGSWFLFSFLPPSFPHASHSAIAPSSPPHLTDAGPRRSETFPLRLHFLNSPTLLSQRFLFGDISDGLGNSLVVTSDLLM